MKYFGKCVVTEEPVEVFPNDSHNDAFICNCHHREVNPEQVYHEEDIALALDVARMYFGAKRAGMVKDYE